MAEVDDHLKSLHASIYSEMKGNSVSPMLAGGRTRTPNTTKHPTPKQKSPMDAAVSKSLLQQLSGMGSFIAPTSPKRTPDKSKDKSANRSSSPLNNSSVLNANVVAGDISSSMSPSARVSVPQPLSPLPAWGTAFRRIGTTDEMILNADFSMSHKRFKGRGTQGAAMCLMAIIGGTTFGRDVRNWNPTVLTNLLIEGDKQHHLSMELLEKKCSANLFPYHIYTIVQILDTTFKIGTPDLYAKECDPTTLIPSIKMFTEYVLNELGPEGEHELGFVISCQGKHVAFWKFQKYYMLFDPSDHELDGRKWTGLPGEGFAFLKRCGTIDALTDAILSNYKPAEKFSLLIHPCWVESMKVINRTPPESLVQSPRQLEPPLKPASFPKTPTKMSAFKQVSGLEKSVSEKKKTPKSSGKKPPTPTETIQPESQEPEEPGIKPSKERVPKEPSRIKSESHFIVSAAAAADGAISVLNSSTHQRDPKFTRYRNGDQAIMNATAALCMLKVHKAKHWVTKIMDEVLKSGERAFFLCKDTGEIKDCTVEGRHFATKLERFEAIGKLQSDNPRALVDLEVCLRDFLNEHTATILLGPVVVAVWFEDGAFYMFDPDPRLPDGSRPFDKVQLSDSDAQTSMVDQYRGGKAVLMRFDRLKDLVRIYMENLPPGNARDYFNTVKVIITDFEEPLEPWNNFTRLSTKKWIISGTFSQKDSRFEHEFKNSQCTAMAAMSCAYRLLQPMDQWTRDTVDAVLTQGDQYYQETIEELRTTGRFRDPQLMAGELNRAYKLDDRLIEFDIDDCLINGLWDSPSEEDFLNLRKGFDQFFDQSEGGILTVCGQSFGVWKLDDAFYYFDSHMRNPQGVATRHGTACVQRILDTRHLSEAVRTNLTPNGGREYNLSRLGVEIFLMTEEGTIKIELRFFTKLNENKMILRGNSHHKEFEKWFINFGKIHVNCCMVAMAFDKIEPVSVWGTPEMDKIMTLGNQHYKLSRKQLYDDPMARDEIDQENMRRDILVGINKLDYAAIENHTVTGLDALKDALANLFDPNDHVYQSNKAANPDEPPPCILLTSDLLCQGIWTDGKAWYLYDPAPRDETGDIIGRDSWTLPPEPEPEENAEANAADPNIDVNMDANPEGNPDVNADSGARGDPVSVPEPNPIETIPPAVEPSEGGGGGEGGEGAPAPSEGEVSDLSAIKIKHSAMYWTAKEMELGKSCVLRLTRIEDLYEHLTQNTPPMKKDEMAFTLTSIKFDNETLTADVFDPEEMEKELPNQGDWNHFVEVDYLKWALRGTRNMDDELYPELNRNKQAVAMCLVALGEARLYSMDKFESWVVDEIGMYGDRLLSAIKKTTFRLMKAKQQDSNDPMNEFHDDILEKFSHMFTYTPDHIVTAEKSFLIKDTKIHQDLRDTIKGHLNVGDDVDHTLNLRRALYKMFSEGISEMCLVESKGVTVAVWRSENYYYMYDPYVRSPNGSKASVGFPCITRFCDLSLIVERFESNLPKDKPSNFTVWPVVCTVDVAVRFRSPETPATPPRMVLPKLGGFSPVVPGKEILRSGEKLDYTKFDRGIHKHSTAIAVVALATSLFIKPETWTQIIVDDILKHGEWLYQQSVQALAPRFNPWVERLDLHRVLHDFMYGNLKVNFEIRFRDERGVVYDKSNSQLQNLRQGLEKFFIKNVYGVLVIGDMAFAIWEEDREDSFVEEVTTHLYLYDPNTRGATGLPMLGGTACLMKFLNATMAADHVKSCLPPNEWSKLLYTIHPLEFLIGQQPGRKRRHKHRVYRQGVTHMGEFTAKTVPGYSPKGQSPKAGNITFRIHEATEESINQSSIYQHPPTANARLVGTPGRNQSIQNRTISSPNQLQLPYGAAPRRRRSPSGSLANQSTHRSLPSRHTPTSLEVHGSGFQRVRTPEVQFSTRPRTPASPNASGFQRVPTPQVQFNNCKSATPKSPKASSQVEDASRLHWPSSPKQPFGGIFCGTSPISTAKRDPMWKIRTRLFDSGMETSVGGGADEPVEQNQSARENLLPTPHSPRSLGPPIHSSSPMARGHQRVDPYSLPPGTCVGNREASMEQRLIRSMADMSRAERAQKSLDNFGRHKFEKVVDYMFILRARALVQRDRQLCYCYIWRIAISEKPNIGKWTSADLDNIIASGEQLYMNWTATRQPGDTNTAPDLTNLSRTFEVDSKAYQLYVVEPKDTFASLEPKEINDVLTRFFELEYKYVILFFEECYYPVAFQGGYYYLFDFYPCDHRGIFSGQSNPGISAVILRFDDLLQLGARMNSMYVTLENRNASFALVQLQVEVGPPGFNVGKYQIEGVTLLGQMNKKTPEFWIEGQPQDQSNQSGSKSPSMKIPSPKRESQLQFQSMGSPSTSPQQQRGPQQSIQYASTQSPGGSNPPAN